MDIVGNRTEILIYFLLIEILVCGVNHSYQKRRKRQNYWYALLKKHEQKHKFDEYFDTKLKNIFKV